jgi:hypothetical protein
MQLGRPWMSKAGDRRNVRFSLLTHAPQRRVQRVVPEIFKACRSAHNHLMSSNCSREASASIDCSATPTSTLRCILSFVIFCQMA